LNKGEFTKTTLPIVWPLFTQLSVESLKPTSWAQSYPWKYTNCTTPLQERHFPAPLCHAEKQQLCRNWEKLSLQSSSLQPPKLNVDRPT